MKWNWQIPEEEALFFLSGDFFSPSIGSVFSASVISVISDNCFPLNLLASNLEEEYKKIEEVNTKCEIK